VNTYKYDLILDFETFGKDATKCAAVDVSAMIFSWDKMVSDDPYTMKDIFFCHKYKLSVMDQVKNYGYEIDKSTVEWWESLGPEVRANVKPRKDDLTVKEFTERFMLQVGRHVPAIEHWWTRSNTFDPIIIERLFADQGKLMNLQTHLKYWKVRDTRTYIDAKLDFPKVNGFIPIKDEEYWKETFKEHDSSWDILADVLRLQAIRRAENDLEMIER